MKYRKKQVIIEAFTLSRGDYPQTFIDAIEDGTIEIKEDSEQDVIYADIKTLEGTMRAEHDDYIIRGVQGEFYPCKPDIFEATYEAVEEELDMGDCMLKDQYDYIKRIQDHCVEWTNMTESEAWDFGFRCWQLGYVRQPGKKLLEVPVGGIIKSSIGVEYIVLEHNLDGTRVIRKDLLNNKMEFDSSNNNYANSDIDKYLNDEYLKNEIIPGFGEESVVDRDINLWSLDGFDDYGHYTTKIGLLTFDDYRKYHKNILNKNMESLWWLSTPHSTHSGSGDRYVQCVRSIGDVSYRGCGFDRGVRPDLILKSSIFVSL